MNLIQNQKGTAMVELAITLPLILSLLCGTIEFGVLFYNKQVITNASREGARAGIPADITPSEIRTIVKNYSNDKLICLKNAIAIVDDDIDIDVDGDDDLSVSITRAYPFLFSQILGFGTSVNISASTVMRKEQEPETETEPESEFDSNSESN